MSCPGFPTSMGRHSPLVLEAGAAAAAAAPAPTQHQKRGLPHSVLPSNLSSTLTPPGPREHRHAACLHMVAQKTNN